jgi:hypothetical protein
LGVDERRAEAADGLEGFGVEHTGVEEGLELVGLEQRPEPAQGAEGLTEGALRVVSLRGGPGVFGIEDVDDRGDGVGGLLGEGRQLVDLVGPVQKVLKCRGGLRLRQFFEQPEALPSPLVNDHAPVGGARERLIDRVYRDGGGRGDLLGQVGEIVEVVEPVDKGRQYLDGLRLRQLLCEPQRLAGPFVEHHTAVRRPGQLVVDHVGGGLKERGHLALDAVEPVEGRLDRIELVEETVKRLTSVAVL